jgi:hypothetical protein
VGQHLGVRGYWLYTFVDDVTVEVPVPPRPARGW